MTGIVSCDPLYQFDAVAIRERIDATSPEVLEQTRANADAFVWSSISSVDELGAIRMAAMAEFLEDYDRGLAEQRYLPASLPSLPFADASFDLALCSHFLFLYSERLDADFHAASVLELCRVARQVRIFRCSRSTGSARHGSNPCCDRLRGAWTCRVTENR